MDARRDRSGLRTPRTRIAEIHVPPAPLVLGKNSPNWGCRAARLSSPSPATGEFVMPNDQTEILADDALLVLTEETAREIALLVLVPQSRSRERLRPPLRLFQEVDWVE